MLYWITAFSPAAAFRLKALGIPAKISFTELNNAIFVPPFSTEEVD
jgi:hypothetical protein